MIIHEMWQAFDVFTPLSRINANLLFKLKSCFSFFKDIKVSQKSMSRKEFDSVFSSIFEVKDIGNPPFQYGWSLTEIGVTVISGICLNLSLSGIYRHFSLNT